MVWATSRIRAPALNLGRFLVPVSFQAAGDEPILGIGGEETSLRQIGFVACALDAELPLVINLASAGFDLLRSTYGRFQLRGGTASRKARATSASTPSPGRD